MDTRFWVRAISIFFMIAIGFLSIAIVVGLTLLWGFGIDRLGSNFLIIAQSAPVPERRLIGFIAAAIPSLFSLTALWHLLVMFRTIRNDQPLNRTTLLSLRRFSAYAVLATLSAIALSGTIRWAMGAFSGQTLWTHLHLAPIHLSVLFMAGVSWVASCAIDDGLAKARELEGYV